MEQLTKSKLAIILSNLKGFSKPKLKLEQYVTPSEIAATMLWHAYLNGHVEGNSILDLGCGTGILSIGALLLGAQEIVALDVDLDALEIFHENLKFIQEKFNLDFSGKFKLLNLDVKDYNSKESFDSVIMNPPFGTKEKHIDTLFLEKAFQHSNFIYSIHKTSTLDFLKRFASSHNFCMEIISKELMPIKASFSFHKKKIERIDTSIIFFKKC